MVAENFVVMKRALLLVLDSVGCGSAPDAAEYGDEGADTLGHLYAGVPGFRLPNLESMGLGGLLGLDDVPVRFAGSRAFRLTEVSAGKDTTTGHWELVGCPLESPFLTFDRFPDDFVSELELRRGVRFIGNKVASGTEILDELGGEHFRSGHPILYTSADSVLQIAAHEESFGLVALLELCTAARALLDEKGMRVGRVIARPFIGSVEEGFSRTSNRRDYSLMPGETILNRLGAAGVEVVGVGKIADIFAGSGVEVSHPTKTNADGMGTISELWANPADLPQFIFANLVDFDSLYGHRRNPEGYADCLLEFDRWLGGFLLMVLPGDLVIITADHGNDPYHPGTDHTREQVPCMVICSDPAMSVDLRLFSDVAGLVGRYFLS